MSAPSPNWIANGTIQPSRFVSVDRTAGKLFNVIQSVLNDQYIMGVAQEGSYDAPGVSGSATDAARAGLPLKVYGLGEVCLLKIGAGGCTAGDYLQSDANGQGITLNLASATTTVQFVGARALETAVAGEFARVLVAFGPITTS